MLISANVTGGGSGFFSDATADAYESVRVVSRPGFVVIWRSEISSEVSRAMAAAARSGASGFGASAPAALSAFLRSETRWSGTPLNAGWFW